MSNHRYNNNHNHSNNNHHSNSKHSHNNSHSYNSSHSYNNQHNSHYRHNHLHNNNNQRNNNRWQSHSNKSMSKEYDCSKPSNNSNKNNNNNHSNHSCSRHNRNNRLGHNPFFSHKATSPAPRAFLSDMSNPALSPAPLSPLLLKSTLPLFPSNPILSFPRTLAHLLQHAPSLLCQQEQDLKMKVARSKWQSLNARKSKTNHLPPKSKKLRKLKKLHRE